jgi:hypothetical protein
MPARQRPDLCCRFGFDFHDLALHLPSPLVGEGGAFRRNAPGEG